MEEKKKPHVPGVSAAQEEYDKAQDAVKELEGKRNAAQHEATATLLEELQAAQVAWQGKEGEEKLPFESEVKAG